MADGDKDKRKSCEGFSRAVSLLREVVGILDGGKNEGETSQNNLSSLSAPLDSQPSTSRQYNVSNSNVSSRSIGNSSAGQVGVSSSGSAK